MKRILLDDGIAFYNADTQIAIIQETVLQDGILIKMEGQFSGEIANDLWDELSSCVIAKQKITLDLSSVRYLSSSVMDVFLRIEQKMETQGNILLLTRAPSSIYEMFKNRGLNELLEIEVEREP